ncbi:MAG: sialate O-acetylesterase [Lentisphaeria bacterium]|nr:sialate O-acetylesterase [Lentisphaeria bacterium]
MKITRGLFNGQVLQRDDEGVGQAFIAGTSARVGTVELKVSSSEGTIQKWIEAGESKGKKYFAMLQEIPAGGPYKLKLRIRKAGKTVDELTIEEFFVGDVWILAGQSNMEGVGNLSAKPKSHPMVRAFYMHDVWGKAESPVHRLSEAVDIFHNGYGDGENRPSQKELDKVFKERLKGVSPAIYFGKDMFKATGVPQGLIACAHGGTSMAQWSPDLKEQGGASLYGAMLRRFEKLGQPIKGVLWYQGESDAGEEPAKVYTQKMVELIQATRNDFKQPELPWGIVQIGSHICGNGQCWNDIQEQQRLLPEILPYVDVVSANDLELDDGIHVSGKDYKILGSRLSRIMRKLSQNEDINGGIQFKSAELIWAPTGKNEAMGTQLVVKYRNVSKGLTSEGRPHGFVITNAVGDVIHKIYKTKLYKNKVILYLNGPAYTLQGTFLNYGHGCYHYCNIQDKAGMGLPAMSQMSIVCNFPSPIEKMQVKSIQGLKSFNAFTDKKIQTLVKERKGWRQAHCEPNAHLMRTTPEKLDENSCLYRYIHTAKEQKIVDFEFGADAPFKIWLNGDLILEDGNAINHVVLGEYKASVTLKKGRNKMLIAYFNPGGVHWGIIATISE